MAHEAAAHMHVILTDIVIGPNNVLTSLELDNVKSIDFHTNGTVEIEKQDSTFVSVDFHNIDDITCTLDTDAVTFTITGNA